MKKYFYTKKDHKFTWYSPQMKLVFDNMSFQAHDEYASVKDINDILYLYYNIEVFAKKYVFDEEGEEHFRWKKVADKSAYDFPSITELQYILQQYLEDKIPLEDCRVIHYYHCGELVKDRVGYVHSMSTDDFYYDDAYRVERTIIKEHNREVKRYYSLYVGCAMDIQGGGASVGIKMDIPETGLRSLYHCINEFLKDGIIRDNEATKKNFLKEEYSIDNNNRLIKTVDNKITEMFLEDEKIRSIRFYTEDSNIDGFHSECYEHVTLSKFTKDSVTFTGGYCSSYRNSSYNSKEREERVFTVPTRNIIYVFSLCEEPVLSMSEEDIANDLKRIMTKEEIEEIKTSSLSEMNEKWSKIIIDRYIIYRGEHPFKKLKEDERENSREAINTILKLIKN